jgi:formate dehydrogenase alpha subunit
MKVTIDGLPVEVADRKTILEVARDRGIYIPSLCDHPRLAPFTGCRLCIVEVKGRRGVAPACGTQVEDGMEVMTTSPGLQKMRRQILELILSEHPSACLICSEKKECPDYKSTIRKVGEVTGCTLCPNNGRCDLQKVVEHLNVDKVGFPALYRDIDIHKGDPLFGRNYNLCILCGRCVRVCHEVRGASALAFNYRGPWTVIGTALERPLLESGCQFCGACVDVCPTGALFEKAVRYETLPESEKRSVCALCGQGCELQVQLKQGIILSTVPAEDGAVNKGQACVKGRFLVRESVYHPKRATKPLVRKDGKLIESSWDEALLVAAQKLAAFGGEEMAAVFRAEDSCEDVYAFHKFAQEGLRINAVANAADFSAAGRLAELGRANGVTPRLNFRISDLDQAKTVFLFDEDLPVTQPMVWLEVHKAILKGAKLVVFSGQELGLSRCASAWLKSPADRASDVLTCLSKALAETSVETEALKDGWAEFKKKLHEVKMAEILAPLGISEEKVRKLASLLEKRRPAAFLFGGEFSGGPSGTANLTALWNLSLQVQGSMIPLSPEGNARGALEISRLHQASRVRPGSVLRAIRQPGIRALLLAANAGGLERNRPEFILCFDSFLSEGAEIADIVLPQATFLESEGTYVNVEGRIQKSGQTIDSRGESKPGWQIIAALAEKMGLSGFSHKSAAGVFEELAKTVPAFNRSGSANKRAEIFLADLRAETKKFILVGAAGEEAGPEIWPPAVPDSYKGLDLGRDIKSLNIIRGKS